MLSAVKPTARAYFPPKLPCPICRVVNLVTVNPPAFSANTVEARFNEVAGDRVNLFVESRSGCNENLDITNLSGNDQNGRYIEV